MSVVITADDCVEEVQKYLQDKINLSPDTSVKVYQYDEKSADDKGVYIAVNALPFVYGYALNDKNIVNVNLHIPDRSNNRYYRSIGNVWRRWMLTVFPIEVGSEDDDMLVLDKAAYSVSVVSAPVSDADNTHYINFKLKVRFTN